MLVLVLVRVRVRGEMEPPWVMYRNNIHHFRNRRVGYFRLSLLSIHLLNELDLRVAFREPRVHLDWVAERPTSFFLFQFQKGISNRAMGVIKIS